MLMDPEGDQEEGWMGKLVTDQWAHWEDWFTTSTGLIRAEVSTLQFLFGTLFPRRSQRL